MIATFEVLEGYQYQGTGLIPEIQNIAYTVYFLPLAGSVFYLYLVAILYVCILYLCTLRAGHTFFYTHGGWPTAPIEVRPTFQT